MNRTVRVDWGAVARELDDLPKRDAVGAYRAAERIWDLLAPARAISTDRPGGSQ